jgi:hypothetical protein
MLRLSLAALLLSAPLAAADEVRVTMTAETEFEAIRHALAEAVARTRGAEVSSGGTLRPELAGAVRGLQEAQGLADLAYVRQVSHGYVRRYDVLETTHSPEGVTVLIEADVLGFDPENPLPGSRRTAVVEGFEVAPGAIDLGGEVEGVDTLRADLRRELARTLVAARKYSVLTARNLGEATDQALARRDPGLPTAAEPWRERLHRSLGADVLVQGTIEKLFVRTETSTVKLTGHQSRHRAAEVQVELRIVDLATGAVERSLSHARSYAWDDAELAADPALADEALLARGLVEAAARDLALRLVRDAFPLLVIDVAPGLDDAPVLYLNAGAALYGVGDTFEVVEEGPALVDPDTGEVLGHREQVVAIARIVEQDDRLSRARLVEPTPDQLHWASSFPARARRTRCRPMVLGDGR